MHTRFTRYPALCLLSLAGCLLPLALHAGKYYAFSPAARDVYQKTIRLRWSEAFDGLEAMRTGEPDNLIILLLDNYLEVMAIAVDDDRQAYQRLAKRVGKRLDQLAKGDRHSPYFLYCQAEVRLQWALLHGRYSRYLNAAGDFKQAFSLLEENKRRFPDFLPNLKSLGVLHALVGTVPAEYHWIVKAVSGMEGSVAQGLDELRQVLDAAKTQDVVFEEETAVAYAFLQLHLNNQSDLAWQTLRNSRLNPADSPLAAFALANLAFRSGRTDEAIRLLEAAPAGSAYYPFYYRDFLLGHARLCRLDGQAFKPLDDFLQYFKGETGVKEACQKRAWCDLLFGNPAGYRAWMQEVKKRGNTRSEPDKAAQREAESGRMPDVRLLAARLLFDGGYYLKAYEKLQGVSFDNDPRLQLEYQYRQGRIAHKRHQFEQARQWYQHTLQSSADPESHYACNAALQLGLLEEETGDYPAARTAFKRCLDLHPDDFAAGLHTRAKAGLQRVRAKK